MNHAGMEEKESRALLRSWLFPSEDEIAKIKKIKGTKPERNSRKATNYFHCLRTAERRTIKSPLSTDNTPQKQK